MHPIRQFRDRLASDTLCLGPSITFTDLTVTEALCDSSDFLWIDTEHNPMNLESVTGHLIAAKACGTPALVRVPSSQTSGLKRVLDSGADGVIVPQVRTVEEVQGVVDDCRYPPLGTRGFGPRRPSNYGRFGGDEYIRMMNEEIFVAVQIEHIDAYHVIDDIVTIKGLDAIVIGPMDLSASMGIPGQFDHPDVVQTIESTINKSRAAGLYVGMGMGANESFALTWAQKGVQWIQLGCDFEYLIQRFDILTASVRQGLS
jgi:2-keto-3-deoxy-L-rhamnonate aldolase RhmA